MNIPNQFIEVDSESVKLDSVSSQRSQIMHLLAGLERQKEELGPIAVELIGLLHRLGVGTAPQANGKSQSSKS